MNIKLLIFVVFFIQLFFLGKVSADELHSFDLSIENDLQFDISFYIILVASHAFSILLFLFLFAFFTSAYFLEEKVNQVYNSHIGNINNLFVYSLMLENNQKGFSVYSKK